MLVMNIRDINIIPMIDKFNRQIRERIGFQRFGYWNPQVLITQNIKQDLEIIYILSQVVMMVHVYYIIKYPKLAYISFIFTNKTHFPITHPDSYSWITLSLMHPIDHNRTKPCICTIHYYRYVVFQRLLTYSTIIITIFNKMFRLYFPNYQEGSRFGN